MVGLEDEEGEGQCFVVVEQNYIQVFFGYSAFLYCAFIGLVYSGIVFFLVDIAEFHFVSYRCNKGG